jgi:16S rRNA A1518/A1519 N6-dimethyltransferase RsmA/KsgA/DIM1 with predicted DNA glycosylase/AP lyase activity
MKGRKNNLTKINEREQKIYGDFQTPMELTTKITKLLIKLNLKPVSIIEPTCGTGNFIIAALESFPEAAIIGYEINSSYVEQAEKRLIKSKNLKPEIHLANFFQVEWEKLLQSQKEPLLILGNLPWVTNSEIGAIGGTNLPLKSNLHKLSGLDAMTGSSNFDISESMIIQLLKGLSSLTGYLAMLCKISVARKVLKYAYANNIQISSACLYKINSKKYFNAVVQSCLLLCTFSEDEPSSSPPSYKVYSSFESSIPHQKVTIIDDTLIANSVEYYKTAHLAGTSKFIWRSGIKHDCAPVMKLTKTGSHYLNSSEDRVLIEDNLLFPLLTGNDLAKNTISSTDLRLIVTQKVIGEETATIEKIAPLTWKYLQNNKDLLSNRKSSIYNNQPPFSIFGVGPYSFSPWKVAISGFHKNLNFRLISPIHDKPVVFDDTCYFIPCSSFEEAIVLKTLLDHPLTHQFYNSYIFWDNKRPITKTILKKLRLESLIPEIGSDSIITTITHQFPTVNSSDLLTVIQSFL